MAVAPALLVISVESWVVRPDLLQARDLQSILLARIALIVVSTITLISGLATRREMRAFVGSNFLLVGLLATGARQFFR